MDSLSDGPDIGVFIDCTILRKLELPLCLPWDFRSAATVRLPAPTARAIPLFFYPALVEFLNRRA